MNLSVIMEGGQTPVECYKKIIRKHLGKAATKHHMDILFCLTCVDCDLKPAFLFDYTCVSAVSMAPFLTELHSEGFLRSCLKAMAVAEDLFIYKDQTLLKHVDTLKAEVIDDKGPILVDVSQNLSQPNITTQHSEIVTALDIITQHIKDSSGVKVTHPAVDDSHSMTLVLPDEVNRTSVFGLLLGYPVLYWYEIPDCRNCLDMVPLCVSSVSAELEFPLLGSTYSGCVYSFSHPDIVPQFVCEAVNCWWEKLKQGSELSLNFKQEMKTLPCVAM